jgi:hypothetical protein
VNERRKGGEGAVAEKEGRLNVEILKVTLKFLNIVKYTTTRAHVGESYWRIDQEYTASQSALKHGRELGHCECRD